MIQPTEISTAKKALRIAMNEQRNALNPEIKKKYDQAICELLWQEIDTQKHQVIHAFLSMGAEVNILPLLTELLQANKTVVCPQTLTKRQLKSVLLSNVNDIETGLYNTQQPANPQEYVGALDFIIVPGLAFDANNFRLGYGGGYYDGFLSQFPNAKKIGIGYPFQMIEKVPRETHDQQLDGVFFLNDL